ncbi:DUF4097 family beta strand repeat-containing protein [Streptococcus sp. zg-JUN1979]|uniref:DUF4097 family beta strand repeat-containing protein n=1 Tax=Streptococcus sp. zg-JUN1979 TaxID=3391450 RepID=UPI0039A6F4F9
MKTWEKIVLGLGLLLTFLGVIILIMSYQAGALDDLKAKAQETVKTQTKTLDNFDTLTIASDEHITIKTANISKPTISYQNTKYQKTSYTLSDKTLTLRNQVSPASYTINPGLLELARNLSEISSGITLTLPTSMRLKTIQINSASLLLNQVNLDNLTLKTDSYISISDSQISHSSIDTNYYITIEQSSITDSTITSHYDNIELDNIIASQSTFTAIGADMEAHQATFKGANSITADTVDISLDDYNLTLITKDNIDNLETSDKLTPSADNQLTITNAYDISIN